MLSLSCSNNPFKEKISNKAVFFSLLLWMILISKYGSASHQELKLTGDIIQIAIPATAFFTTLAIHDLKGTKEFLTGFLATGLTTYSLKYAINERRPLHGYQSFPSGHTALAFFGSGFIHQRYGWQYAIPAYASACFVGYSRLKIKEHWIQDIIGGAVIGWLASYLFTTSYQNCHFYPSVSSQQVAFLYERSF